MEIWLKAMADHVGLLLEIIVVIVVLLGGVRALAQLVTKLAARRMTILPSAWVVVCGMTSSRAQPFLPTTTMMR